MKKEPLHILLADDDEADRLLFKEAIEELGIKTIIHTVNNGMKLMEYLAKKDMPLPDILFLDLNMPRKNGLACLKEIKTNQKLEEIAIAIYSTSRSEQDVENAFINGANIYLHKPNDFNVLKQSLKKIIISVHQYQNQSMNRDNFLLRV